MSNAVSVQMLFLSVCLSVSVCLSLCLCLFLYLKKNYIDKSTEWFTIPACPSLMCFFNRAIPKGHSSKKFCLMFVYVFWTFVSGLILLFLDNLWFDDLRAG